MPDQPLEDYNRTSAPKLGQFDNKVTGTTLALFLICFLPTPFLAYAGIVTPALILGACWGLMLCFWVKKHSPGNSREHPEAVREAGVITFLDNIWEDSDGDEIVVGGTTLVPRPFFDTIVVDIENKNHTFTVPIISSDKVPMDVNVLAVTRANVCDLPDYIQAGNSMEKVFMECTETIFKTGQRLCRELPSEDILMKSELITDPLKTDVRNLFGFRSFGAELINITIEAQLPLVLKDKLIDAKGEEIDSITESREYKTDTDAALRLQFVAAKRSIPDSSKLTDREIEDQIATLVDRKTIRNLDFYIKTIQKLRLIRDSKTTRIESSGNLVNLNGVKIN